MNYLQKYLSNNLILKNVHKTVFNNQPMIIDHLAHRTFKNEKICNEYTKKDTRFRLHNDRYNFRQHNAYAEWWNYTGDKFDNPYANSLKKLNKGITGTPRIFISTYSGVNHDKNLKNSDIDLNKVNWHIDHPNSIMSFDFYKKIYEKNQYLAWTLVHRNNINHIGIEVEDIENTLEKVSKLLPLNNPNAPIQISEDKNLLQFSTKSTVFPIKFEEGTFEVPYQFLEFVERKNNREGFSEKNANIVFNSTATKNKT